MPVIDETEIDDEYDEMPEQEDGEFTDEDDMEESPEVDFDEDLITAATLLVRMENKASVSLLQRRLKLGYSKAARIMDELGNRGVVSASDGSAPRQVLAVDAPED